MCATTAFLKRHHRLHDVTIKLYVLGGEQNTLNSVLYTKKNDSKGFLPFFDSSAMAYFHMLCMHAVSPSQTGTFAAKLC